MPVWIGSNGGDDSPASISMQARPASRPDPETRTLRFARPNGSQSYTGVVTGNTISGRFTWEGGSYPWSASR